MTEHVISADGTRIAYDRHGDGPPVVLVHGATHFRAYDAVSTQVAQHLATAGFTAVVYDRRGRGDSTDTAPYAVAREVEDLTAVIGAVGGRAAVFGASSGAVLALHAAQAGAPISKLVLFEPPLLQEDDGRAFLRGLQERVEAGDRDGAITLFMGDVPEEWVEGVRQSPSYAALWSIAPTLPYDAAVLAEALDGTPWDVLWGGVHVPVQVLVGDKSLPLYPQAGRRLESDLPHATLRKVPSEQAPHRARLLASLLRDALDPYDGCGWPCRYCGTAARESARAEEQERPVDLSGPLPMWVERG